MGDIHTGALIGKVAVLTGGTGNLGRAVTRRLHQEGAQLALLVRDPDRAKALFKDLDDDRLLLLEADLLDEASVAAAVQQVQTHWGGIDMLANLAGGFRMAPAVHAGALQDFRAMLDLNFYAALHSIQAVVPALERRGGGQIVNIGAAVEPAPAQLAAYAASKSALLRLTEALSAEWRGRGIQVNAILPGIIDTPENRAAMPDADISGWVSPEQLAEVIAFLVSPGAEAVHGALIPVTGTG